MYVGNCCVKFNLSIQRSGFFFLATAYTQHLSKEMFFIFGFIIFFLGAKCTDVSGNSLIKIYKYFYRDYQVIFIKLLHTILFFLYGKQRSWLSQQTHYWTTHHAAILMEMWYAIKSPLRRNTLPNRLASIKLGLQPHIFTETFIPEDVFGTKEILDIWIKFPLEVDANSSLILQVDSNAFRSTKTYTKIFTIGFLSGFDKLIELQFSNIKLLCTLFREI